MTSPDQRKEVVKSHEGDSHPTTGGIPAEDVKFAEVAVRVHCAISYPDGDRCLNCGPVHPCETYEWGRGLLLSAGYTDGQIRELDTRTGPWS
ncbi:MAG TPA: hypothetical protein DGG94_01225 [Micromonosporaceae bacterium]|nr:hypothetical protein [Micromonosporaceae bacterium]HCU48450.1 hypothetical protein [Micromonosporaceae bacterium]